MKARVLERCERCRRLGYGFRHVMLSVDGQHMIDKTLCRPCASAVERAAVRESV